MTIKNGDRPAMPITYEQATDADMWGLSKREMMAMHMMAANRARGSDYQTWELMAQDAVEAADALLSELERTK